MIQRYHLPTESRWDPFAEMAQLHRAMNRLFGDVDGTGETFPAINVYANEDEAVVSAEVPGVDPEHLEISASGNALTLSGSRQAEDPEKGEAFHRNERFSGRFTRTLELPFNIDAAGIKAQLRHGILKVTLPRAEADKPKKIKIEQ